MAQPQQIPLNIAIAPFPEGFEGDMDETFQQAVQLMEAFIEGNFLTGLVLPPGSTLPSSDQGPIAMGNQWYFWDSATSQYLPQTISSKVAKNFVRNCIYQVQQTGTTPTIGAGINKTYDMLLCRATASNILAIAPDVGPLATVDNDLCTNAAKYTVGPSIVTTLASSDIYAHEHLIEGADLVMIQGQTMSLGFSVWCNVPGTYSAYLTNGNRDASWCANFTVTGAQASTWIRVKFNAIPALPAIGTWTFSEGTTGLYLGVALALGAQWQTANPNKWNSGFFGGTAQNNSLLGVVNNQMKITGVKLEAAPACSYLSVLPFGSDYDEVLRYYFTTFNYQSVTAGVGLIANSQATNTQIWQQNFPRRMCKTPVVTPYGWSSHTAGNITNISTSTDVATASLTAAQKGVIASTTATSTKGDVFACLYVADARLS